MRRRKRKLDDVVRSEFNEPFFISLLLIEELLGVGGVKRKIFIRLDGAFNDDGSYGGGKPGRYRYASRSRQATTDTDSAEYNVAFEWVIKHKAF